MIKTYKFLFPLFLIFLFGCSAGSIQSNEINLTGKYSDLKTDFQESSDISQNLKINEENIPLPENGSSSSYCEYDGVIYYEVDYADYFDNPTGEKQIKFEDKYNTQIRCYNIKNKEDNLLYQYDENKCVTISNMCSNGKYLVWQEYGVTNGIRKISLQDKSLQKNPETILDDELKNGKFDMLSLTMTDKYLYWYNITGESSDENFISLFRYDLKTNEISTERTKLSLTSPYERVGIINNIMTTYQKDGNSMKINVLDMKKGKESNIIVDTGVRAPISNGKICVWMKDYEDNSWLYIYDIEKDVTEKINSSDIFSYALVGDFLILNRNEISKSGTSISNLYCYDVRNKKFQKISGDNQNKLYFYINQGVLGNAYVNSSDSSNLAVVNIESNKTF